MFKVGSKSQVEGREQALAIANSLYANERIVSESWKTYFKSVNSNDPSETLWMIHDFWKEFGIKYRDDEGKWVDNATCSFKDFIAVGGKIFE